MASDCSVPGCSHASSVDCYCSLLEQRVRQAEARAEQAEALLRELLDAKGWPPMDWHAKARAHLKEHGNG